LFAVQRDQPGAAQLQLVQQDDVDPVTGVQDGVGLLDRRPHLGRQFARPPRHVRVGQDSEPHRR
jgi:hypothetical protein